MKKSKNKGNDYFLDKKNEVTVGSLILTKSGKQYLVCQQDESEIINGELGYYFLDIEKLQVFGYTKKIVLSDSLFPNDKIEKVIHRVNLAIANF